MYFLNSQLFNLIGKMISCIVSVVIIFQYFDASFLRVFHEKHRYFWLKVSCCVLNCVVYFLDNPVVNLSFWMLVILVVSKFFYYDQNLTKIKYYLTNLAFVLACSICESVGGLLVNVGINIIGVSQNEMIISFVLSVGGSASLILLYYLVLKNLFLSKKVKRISVRQYTIYAVITLWVLLNIGQFLFLLRHELSSKDGLYLLVDAVFIIFINLYLFYVLDALTENKDLKFRLALYERQSKSSYEYYLKQIESRRMVLSVIHDVKKHINVIKELANINLSTEVENYSESFEKLVIPLLSTQYSDNAILNVILNDKMDYCKKNRIRFDLDIQEVQLDLMEAIDITTLFGNILDNAVEASEKAEEKRIVLKIYPFNGFVFVQLTNTFKGTIKWDGKGKPLSERGEEHGIGLQNVENVLKRYNGNMQIGLSKSMFTVEIMFS